MGKFNTLAFALAVARASLATGAAFKYGSRVPRSLRVFLAFLLALNISSFPLVWHARILSPWFKVMWTSSLVHRLRGPKGYQKRLTDVSFVGKSPFDPDVVHICKRTAYIADCDYNTHLNNASYAKNLDQARMDGIIKFFHGCAQTGIIMALGGGSFHFIKEIPLHAEYEIHFFISGWDDKWIYLTAAFVTFPKGKNHRSEKTDSTLRSQPTPQQLIENAEESVISGSTVMVPPVLSVADVGDATFSTSTSLAPSRSVSGTTTPAELSSSSTDAAQGGAHVKGGLSYNAIHPLTERLPEGATLHATAMSVYCFKHGRVTVPPRIALILSGYGSPSSSSEANERWEKFARVRTEKGGRRMKDILRGGWKEQNAGGDDLGAGFWDFEEFESEGQRRAKELRRVRDVMDTLAGR